MHILSSGRLAFDVSYWNFSRYPLGRKPGDSSAAKKGNKMKVKFVGCSDVQINWGGGHDPRKFLEIGKEYLIERKEVHTYHTLYFLKDVDSSKGFNSACFLISGNR